MNLTRRGAAALGAALFLAACTGGPTQAQIVADAQGLVTVVQSTVATIVASSPNAISLSLQAKIAAAEASATAALDAIAGATTPAATAKKLQIVETYLNLGLTAIGAAIDANPVLAAKYGTIFTAAQALLVGVIEPYIAQVVATGVAPAPSPAFAKQRAVLGIH